jgi:hypothetical protein
LAAVATAVSLATVTPITTQTLTTETVNVEQVRRLQSPRLVRPFDVEDAVTGRCAASSLRGGGLRKSMGALHFRCP